MRYLDQFFDWEAFSKDKVFQVVGVSEWTDYDTKEHLGTRIDVAIVRDDTHYEFKPGEIGTNKYERISWKIARDDVDVSLDSYVKASGVYAKAWGKYHENLKVIVQDIQVLKPKQS